MPDRYLGDVGQTLQITIIGADPLLFPTRAINIRKPSGTTVAWTPSSVTSSAVSYVFVGGDLNEVGAYNGSVNLQITTPVAYQVTSSPFQFTVGLPP